MFTVGVVGRRGLAYVPGIRSVQGFDVVSLCELDASAQADGQAVGIPGFTASYEQLVEACDAVVIGTPMHLHASQATAALSAGKHVLSEVTAAVSQEECLLLARAAANSAGCYFFAENYCYFEENLLALELVRQGRFGPLSYGEGDYVHEVRFLHHDKQGRPTWRKRWQVGQKGNTYCTHELGPLMRMFRAQDPEVRISGVSCFGTGPRVDRNLNHDDTTLTMVQLSNGGLIKLKLDMVSNRPHSVRYEVVGLTGAYESGDGHRFWFGEDRPVSWDESEQREWKPMTEFADAFPDSLADEISEAKAHGHGGGDYFVGRRFAQAVSTGTQSEIGIFEAVEWTMAGLLSQESILNESAVVPMPAWVYGG